MRKRTQAHNTRRRGLAMLLVIISVIIATVLATAYLASRDNSLPIGDNAKSAASARWSALSSIDVAIAVIETRTDWRTADPTGELL